MKTYRVFLGLVLLALIRAHPLFAGLPVTGGVDLLQKWYIMESEHFRVCFPPRLKELAGLITDEAEEAYKDLNRWAGYTIEENIDIIITDNSDLANGFVRSGTRGFYITLYTVFPYQDFVEGSDAYMNWYRNILIHELSHIAHQQKAGGFFGFLNRIFGRLLYPNTTMPRFYREGFATYAETVNESGHGRGNYPYTDMYVSTAIEETNPPLLDRMSSRTSVWPGTTGPYLYGVSFVNYLVSLRGEEALFEFNDLSSNRLSFTGSMAFQEVYDKPLYESWEDWLEIEREKSRVPAHEEKTPLSALSSEHGWVYSLAVSGSGDRAVYSIRPTDKLGGLFLYDFIRKEERCLKQGLYCENLMFSEDDSRLYYIRGGMRKNVYYENNIYEFDLERGREKKVTESGHVQGFVFTREDSELLVCSSTPYGTEIRIIDRDRKTKKVLVPEESKKSLPIIEQPAVSPDGSLAAFSCKDSEGNRGIYAASVDDLRKGEAFLRMITPKGQNAYSPEWLNEKELLWVGDRGGVYNIYRLNIENGRFSRVTDVRTGVFDPAIGPDGTVLMREYTSSGFRVSFCTPTEQESGASKGTILYGSPGSEEVLLSSHEGEQKARYAEGAEEEILPEETFKMYDPAGWLFPGYWSPLYFDNRISLGLGFYTSARDLLQRHAYRTGVLYDVFDTKVKSFFDYTYYSYPFNYFFSIFASQRTDTGTFLPAVALFPGISFPLIERDFFLKADLGVVVEPPYTGIDLSLLYSDRQTPLHWIGPEKGIIFEQGIYYNIAQDDFVILSDYLSWYIRILDPFLLTFSVLSRWDLSGGERAVVGAYSEYLFVPMNGVYTRGYPEALPARFAMDLKTTLSVPLLTVDRGIGALPFFFEGAKLSFFFDSGLAVSQSGGRDFFIGSFQDLLDDPAGHIRSSIGPQLELDFIVGYDYPLTAEIGYVYPLSSGGSSGLFMDMKIELAF